MKITLDIEENKLQFFLELIKNLKFVKSYEEGDELSEEHKKIISQRLDAIEEDPGRLISLDKVLSDLREA